MAREKISTTVYLTPGQDAALKRLSDKTKAPVSVFIRSGIDMILKLNGEQAEEWPAGHYEGAAVS